MLESEFLEKLADFDDSKFATQATAVLLAIHTLNFMWIIFVIHELWQKF